MTVGKDVSALFPDVVNCMQTDNLELKKLVYLYLMNYAKSQPDMAIMAVNTFVKVSLLQPKLHFNYYFNPISCSFSTISTIIDMLCVFQKYTEFKYKTKHFVIKNIKSFAYQKKKELKKQSMTNQILN